MQRPLLRPGTWCSRGARRRWRSSPPPLRHPHRRRPLAGVYPHHRLSQSNRAPHQKPRPQTDQCMIPSSSISNTSTPFRLSSRPPSAPPCATPGRSENECLSTPDSAGLPPGYVTTSLRRTAPHRPGDTPDSALLHAGYLAAHRGR